MVKLRAPRTLVEWAERVPDLLAERSEPPPSNDQEVPNYREHRRFIKAYAPVLSSRSAADLYEAQEEAVQDLWRQARIAMHLDPRGWEYAIDVPSMHVLPVEGGHTVLVRTSVAWLGPKRDDFPQHNLSGGS